MWNSPLLPLFIGPLRLGVVAPDRVLSTNQIELFDIQINDLDKIELLGME